MEEASGVRARKVLVLVNPKSGLGGNWSTLFRAIEAAWSATGAEVFYQLSNSVEDGRRKAQEAVSRGVDVLLVVGGDGMVNTIGAELVGTPVAMGVIPAGSGNGFARHFNIPLNVGKAAAALANAEVKAIDVGYANGRPFFVTCSMAWDATLVRHFEKSPIRGIIPYLFAGAQGFFEYKPQPFRMILDGQEELNFPDPLVCTVANVTQYGGGARIAPQACPDDGYLELVVVAEKEVGRIFAELHRLFDGTLDRIPQVQTRRFRDLRVIRTAPADIQVDGELVNAPAEVSISLRERALKVLVPPTDPAG